MCVGSFPFVAQANGEFMTWHFDNPTEVISDTRVNGFWYPERAFFSVIDALAYSGEFSIGVANDPPDFLSLSTVSRVGAVLFLCLDARAGIHRHLILKHSY